MPNTTITFTEEEMSALLEMINITEMDKESLLGFDKEFGEGSWAEMFTSVDTIVGKITIERTIQNLVASNPEVNKSHIRSQVKKHFQNN